jgi:two-component sensor histidine kinase
MSLSRLFLDLKHTDPKIVLLYRFHISVIFVNLIAFIIDISSKRYENAIIELSVVLLMSLNLFYLRRYSKVEKSSYIFLAIISIALFTLIYINHFATMSVVFVLLLPLTTLLFIRFKYSLLIEILLFCIMAVLLYLEYIYNPANPLVQNPQALFNLAYTAIIIFVFGLLYHFSIVKTFDELDASNRQKEMLLSEVHHRVKNNLNVIASIIGLQANSLHKDEKEQLLKSKFRIESMAIVHEMLYKSDDLENIDFYSYTKRLCDLQLGMSPKDISLNIVASKEQMSLEVMLQLGIIINELLTNSIKYAFEGEKGSISIELQHNEKYKFTYSDNGVAHKNPQELLKSKSLGIKLIHLAARQLNATVRLTNQNGLHYEIEFENE